jgi:hypothetical protein
LKWQGLRFDVHDELPHSIEVQQKDIGVEDEMDVGRDGRWF